MTKAITDFGAGTVTIYPDIDPFLEEIEEEEKINDDWDHLLEFNINDIPLLDEEELSPFVCKMGKSSRNKKRAMENLNFFYQDIGTSSSAGGHLTQEEAAKEALAIRMSQKFALLEEERPIIETMAYQTNTGSDINTMPYRIYEQRGREEMKKVDRGITMLNHTQGEAMGILTNVFGVRMAAYQYSGELLEPYDGFCHQTFRAARSNFIRNAESDSDDNLRTMGTHDDEAGSSRSKRSRQHETVEEVLLPQVHHEFLLWEGCNRDAKSRRFGTKSSVELEEEGFNVYFEGGLHSDEHFNAHDYWLSISQEENLGLSRSHTSTIKKPILRVIHKMITYGLCQRTTRKRAGTQKESQICCGQFISKIARKCRVLTEDVSSVPRVGIPRPPRASMQDLYDRMGRMEIR
ncbi:hypothetical protein Tco_1230332 [Tanacetum coccineum]